MADFDSEIIRELKAGNKVVFEQVFKKHYALLCSEVQGYFRQGYLTEEIVCDVFTRLWLNRSSLEIKTSLKNYLVKSVHNNCIDYYRFIKTQAKLRDDINKNQQESYSLTDIGENPLEYMITQELEDHISEAIEMLPEQYKRAFKLSRIKGLSYDEIAHEMGISVNSVKTNIKNSLAILREKLADYLSVLAFFIVFKN